jgi:GDP-L-fucose synthase
MNYYQGKAVLVTGGTGMIGQPLCELLLAAGAEVTVASLDGVERAPSGTRFIQLDLRSFDNCMAAADGQDIVFHLAGVKGNPKMTAERPASFFVPTLQFSLNMMEAARRRGIKRYLFTSSIGVYEPAELFVEDSVWSTFPSPNDRFAGWAKRICELQAEAYKIEYGWDKISIVRPANVYGPFDNFDPENAMVIPSLIHRALTKPGPLSVWGDGSPIRDFIHSRDVARGMMLVVAKGINEPINLGSGKGVTIREVAEAVAEATEKSVEWDINKPKGDRMRLMDMTRAHAHGFSCEVALGEGIAETIEWYKLNSELARARYNSFTELALRPHGN